MRARAAASAATVLFGAAAGGLAVGRYGAAVALRVRQDSPAGFDGSQLTVHAATADRVTLTRSPASLLPGTYGLAGDSTHATVGPVLDYAAAGPDAVVRRLVRGAPAPGAKVRLTPQAYAGTPGEALGLDHTELALEGELGPLPAWFAPGLRDLWVIAVHGLGTTRDLALNVLPALSRLDVPVLALGYRGDAGAPRPPDGISHLGHTEWRDLDTAMAYALRHGARRLVLYGWSTGAVMALLAARDSAHRDRVDGLVLDSPVLDWRATVRALAAARRLPAPLLKLAVLAAEERTGLDSVHPWPQPPLPAPTLIVHGPDDAVSPWSASRALAASDPSAASLHRVAGARHAAMWNADPGGYEEALRRFLTPLF